MAQVDYFLKLEGIEGESKDVGNKGAIDVLSWSFGEQSTGSAANTGGPGGRPSFQDFHFTAHTSKASPQIFLKGVTGGHIKKAVLSARKAGKEQQEFLKFTFTDVLVSSFQESAADRNLPTDAVSLAFRQVQMEFRSQTATGTLGPPTTAGFDLKQNVKL